MSENVHQMDAYRALRAQEHGARHGEIEPELPLRGGDGGGTSGGMEERVAKLEVHMEHVRSGLERLADVPVRLRAVEVKIDHLPSKGFVVTAAIGTIGGVVALIGLLQHLGLLH